jgi:hypothetical protein
MPPFPRKPEPATICIHAGQERDNDLVKCLRVRKTIDKKLRERVGRIETHILPGGAQRCKIQPVRFQHFVQLPQVFSSCDHDGGFPGDKAFPDESAQRLDQPAFGFIKLNKMS